MTPPVHKKKSRPLLVFLFVCLFGASLWLFQQNQKPKESVAIPNADLQLTTALPLDHVKRRNQDLLLYLKADWQTLSASEKSHLMDELTKELKALGIQRVILFSTDNVVVGYGTPNEGIRLGAN